jgi:pimeloyl-ACP methyl ester carboxylesterase
MDTSSADPALAGVPHVEGVGHRMVDIGELRVHVAEAGEGEPVLLLHGWPQHWYMWREVIERLAPRYRLIVPDLRGFGWSEVPGHGYDGETFARDQIALLDALGIERVKLIGHDWGGWAGFLLALSHPERIEQMVVCNSPHPWPRLRPRLAIQLPMSWYAMVNATPGLGAFAHRRAGLVKMILRLASPRSPFTEEELNAYAYRLREPARARAMSELYRYYFRVFSKVLRGDTRSQRLTVPTLLLFGKRDRGINHRLVEGGYLANAPELQVELGPKAGHFIVNEEPELVAQRALELFGQAV